ncbi:MAG: hypothetical protein ACP5DC_04395 [Halothiobacillaceae bacterium]
MSELVDIIPPAAVEPPEPAAEVLVDTGAALWPWLIALLLLLAGLFVLWRIRREILFAFRLSQLRSAIRQGLDPRRGATQFAHLLADRLGRSDRLGSIRCPAQSPWQGLLDDLEPLRFGSAPPQQEVLEELIDRAGNLNWRGDQ